MMFQSTDGNSVIELAHRFIDVQLDLEVLSDLKDFADITFAEMKEEHDDEELFEQGQTTLDELVVLIDQCKTELGNASTALALANSDETVFDSPHLAWSNDLLECIGMWITDGREKCKAVQTLDTSHDDFVAGGDNIIAELEDQFSVTDAHDSHEERVLRAVPDSIWVPVPAPYEVIDELALAS